MYVGCVNPQYFNTHNDKSLHDVLRGKDRPELIPNEEWYYYCDSNRTLYEWLGEGE